MSTIKVNSIKNTSTDDGGIAIDNSGHVQIDGQQLPTAGALSNRRLTINGAMQVAQRGTSKTGVTTTTYAGPDRFQQILASAGTWTISQSTEAPEGFSTSLKLDCTTASASLSAGALYLFGQKMEGYNVQHLDYNTSSAKTLTLSFWVRSNKTGTYVQETTSFTSGRKISQTYTIDSANTWEKKTLQIPGDTGGSIPNANSSEFNVYWWVVAGTDFTSGTLNTTWGTTANTNRVVGQTVNLADSTDNEFYITGVQLEVGEKATPFEHRSFSDELARCQRYFIAIHDPRLRGTVNSTTIVQRCGMTLPTTMRAAPTYTTTGTYDVYDGGGIGTVTSFSASYTTIDSVEFDATLASGSLTAGKPACFFIGTSTNQLNISAEL